MTQGKHTHGLLVAVRNPAWGKVADIRLNGKAFAFVQSLVEDDTLRLAAAWNACEGIPTEALDAGAVKDMLEALRVAREEIVSLEWVHFNETACPDDTFDAWLSDNEALPVIDAAIARATGGAA